MKKISTVFFVVLIFALTCFPQEDIQEGIKDARTLSASVAELSDNINKLKKLAKEDQDAQDADAALSPFVWRLNIVLDFYDLWLGMKNKDDRAVVYAYLNQASFQFVKRCDRMRATLQDMLKTIKYQDVYDIVRVVDLIVFEMRSLMFYYSKDNDEVHQIITDVMARTGNKDTSEFTTHQIFLIKPLNDLVQLASTDEEAERMFREIEIYILQFNSTQSLLRLWMVMKNNRDRDEVYATFGNVVFECVSSYHTANYNLNYLIIESENEQLISIGNKIEKTMTDINRVLTPYEDEYAKTDKDVKDAITARDNNLKASSLEAEGVYKYSRKDYKDAVSLLEEAIKLRPTYGSAHYYLALSHINLERRQTAINLLNTYLDRMTPLVETATEQDVYYLSKCIELLEEIKEKKFK